jgi:general secretion pathway protein G
MSSSAKVKGFTLLEIMIVVAIIGILVSLGIYKTVGHLDTAREARVQSDLQTLKTQLAMYESRNGFYPTTDQGIKALVSEPTTDPKPAHWSQLFESVPKDPWDNDYIYRCPGTRHPDKYDVFSAGKDRTPDTADDIWP